MITIILAKNKWQSSPIKNDNNDNPEATAGRKADTVFNNIIMIIIRTIMITMIIIMTIMTIMLTMITMITIMITRCE